VDQLEYTTAGHHKPKDRWPICGRCGHKLSLGAKNVVVASRVVDVDSWCGKKGVELSDFGYRSRIRTGSYTPRQSHRTVTTMADVPIKEIMVRDKKWREVEKKDYQEVEVEEAKSPS
jgi:hypothetical protein